MTEIVDAMQDILDNAREIRRQLDTLRAERKQVADILRAFYFSDVSVSSLQPLIELAETLNPGIRAELEAARAGWAKAPSGRVQ